MKLPFVLRSHHERELDYVKADRERIRSERNQFEKDRDAFKYTAEAVAEKYTDTSIVNDRLTEDLGEARAQLAKHDGRRPIADVLAEYEARREALTGALGDPKRKLTWEQAIAEVDLQTRETARLRAECEAERDRADRLEAAAENTPILAGQEDIEAWEARVRAHDEWVRPESMDDRPYEGGSGRPTHPATELLRAQDRCRKLQALLDGRKRVAS